MLSHWSEIFEDATAVVELEIGPEHLPGFYFSCSIVSPRVQAPPSERQRSFASVDLGKPSIRQGYVKMTVVDRHREIDVDREQRS